MSRRTHVAFLRAINIGRRRLTMAQLRDAVAPLGLGDLATWQATGNLAFTADPGRVPGELEVRIAGALAAGLGLEVPTIVRTAEQVRAVAAGVPFTDRQLAATAGRVQVLFVRDDPAPATRAAVLGHGTDRDELCWGERELWWLPRRGIADSRLRVSVIEGLLGPATMRTHGAVAGLARAHL